MILIILGMSRIFETTKTQIVIGLAGGTFLLLMAIQMLISLKTVENPQSQVHKEKPILTGLILSAGNPYFLVWWATVGLTLATSAAQLGIWAFALFAIVHWLCDCVWLQTLSWASFKGTKMLGGKSQRIVLMICSAAMFFFGLFFIYNAAANLIKMN
jgi:threonine/homoserine/homoserine lactone efflux protein